MTSTKGSSPRILLVDDDEELRAALGWLLREQGYDVVEASHGLEALELLDKSQPPPELVVLDMMMPVMNGQEFLDVLRQRQQVPALPVIVFSAAMTPMNTSGARHVLQKPGSVPRILDIVRQYCRA